MFRRRADRISRGFLEYELGLWGDMLRDLPESFNRRYNLQIGSGLSVNPTMTTPLDRKQTVRSLNGRRGHDFSRSRIRSTSGSNKS